MDFYTKNKKLLDSLAAQIKLNTTADPLTTKNTGGSSLRSSTVGANAIKKFNLTNMSTKTQSLLNEGSKVLGATSTGKLTDSQSTTREGIRSTIGQMGPWGAAIAAASSIIDEVGSATGLNLDNIDKDAAKQLGVSKSGTTMNNLMNSLPGNSMIWGSISGKTKDFNKAWNIDSVRNAYGDSVADINAADKLGDKRVLFNKRSINNAIDSAKQKNDIISNIALTNSLRKNSDYSTDLAQQSLNRYAGQNYMDTQIGKNGLKLPEIGLIQKLLHNVEIQKYEDGGKMNILPEGALHARNNHLEDTNSNLVDSVTAKGIPVIAVQENGDIKQVAEIEKNELILTKELTDMIEFLKSDSSDEALIRAGKILAKELITNLDDKQGEVTDGK